LSMLCYVTPPHQHQERKTRAQERRHGQKRKEDVQRGLSIHGTNIGRTEALVLDAASNEDARYVAYKARGGRALGGLGCLSSVFGPDVYL